MPTYGERERPRLPAWVRIRVIGPGAVARDVRMVEDDWYALGGHRHPDQRQRERERTAAAELREWLAAGTHPPGTYTVLVAELDELGVETGTVWGTVKVQHPV